MRISQIKQPFNRPLPPSRPSLKDSFEQAARPATPKPGMKKTGIAREAMTPFTPVPHASGYSPVEIDRMFDIPANNSFLLSGLAEGSPAARFMTAAATGDADTVGAMLAQNDTLPDFANSHGITPLMAAAARGHAAVVEQLAAHPLVNLGRSASAGWTALHFAAHFGHEDAARALLRHHAPVDAETSFGSLPHQMTKDKTVEEIFRQDKNFTRFMKRRQPQHERLQPAKPQPPQAEPPAQREQEPLKSAFLQLLTTLALESGEFSGGRAARDRLNALMAKMDLAGFREAYGHINKTGVSYEWLAVQKLARAQGNQAVDGFIGAALSPSGMTPEETKKSLEAEFRKSLLRGDKPSDLFIRAARTGNAPMMEELHGKFSFPQEVLDAALVASVGDGDYPAAVHRLMLWDASADATYVDTADGNTYPVRNLALWAKKLGALEEMILWSQSPKNWDNFANELVTTAAAKRPYESGDDKKALIQVASLWTKRIEFHRMGGNKLKRAFAEAVNGGDIGTVMAAYAESRVDRFIRGTVEMEKDIAGDAIALALLNNKFEFARKMIAGGHHLKHASHHVMTKVHYNEDKKVAEFATSHLSGKMQVKRIEDIGKPKPMPYMPPPIGAARYGIG